MLEWYRGTRRNDRQAENGRVLRQRGRAVGLRKMDRPDS